MEFSPKRFLSTFPIVLLLFTGCATFPMITDNVVPIIPELQISSIKSIEYLPDGNYIASTDDEENGTILIHELQTGTLIKSISRYNEGENNFPGHKQVFFFKDNASIPYNQGSEIIRQDLLHE